MNSTIWSYTLLSCVKFKPKGNDDKLSEIVKKVQGPLDMWCTFLTRHELLEIDSLPDKLDCPELRKALEVLETVRFTKEEWGVYEARLKSLRDEISRLENAFEKGNEREEGRRIKNGKIGQEVIS